MENICIYLKIEDYLADWLMHNSDSGAVVFPRNSNESNILELALTKPPRDAEPDLPGEGKLAIRLPMFKYKDPRYYNFLGNRGRAALRRAIKVRFRVQLWEDLHRLERKDAMITDIIYSWMEANGISDNQKNFETIRQMYFRLRQKYRKKE